ncbi:hypothetical protein [Clostridium rectalis]|uniref:hypothetical protein n=1 Tax=Clostridium rectalis TaxID=2040295 RepID=UPI000F6318FD|nr:hypothetical protein [Clostridium rectalis]
MKKKRLNTNVPIIFQKLNEFDVKDTRFTTVKIWLMHLGKNLNGSYFDEEVTKKAIPSLANTPILTYIEDNSDGEKDCSDHREVLTVQNGECKIKYLGQAVGVIPETNNAKLESRVCDDGIERTFLTCEGLIWNKWTDIQDIMNRDVKKQQSMELHENYDGFFDEDELFHYTKFQFFGACILGKDVQPAMRSASVELQEFSYKNFAKEIQNKLEMFKEYMKESEEDNVGKTKYTLSNDQIYEILRKELAKRTITIEDWCGDKIETAEYCVSDLIVSENLAIVTDCKTWSYYYGIPYTITGDVAKLDYDSKKPYMRGDWKEIVGEDVNVTADFSKLKKEFDEIVKDFSSNLIKKTISKCNVTPTKEYKELQVKYSNLENENKKLSEFKSSRLKEDRKQAENELFSQYEELEDVKEFSELKNTSNKFQKLEDLEKELALLYVKNQRKFSKNSTEEKKTVKFQVEKTEDQDDGYGGLLNKYVEK